jgi:hypothetical protein
MAVCRYAECRYTEWHYAECYLQDLYVECCYAECRHAECRGTSAGTSREKNGQDYSTKYRGNYLKAETISVKASLVAPRHLAQWHSA